LHRFQDITTFTVLVTAHDLDKSFSFNKTVEVIQATCAFRLIGLCKHIVVNTRYVFRGMGGSKFQTTKVTFKISQRHWY